jgi:hypothetical protein
MKFKIAFSCLLLILLIGSFGLFEEMERDQQACFFFFHPENPSRISKLFQALFQEFRLHPLILRRHYKEIDFSNIRFFFLDGGRRKLVTPSRHDI